MVLKMTGCLSSWFRAGLLIVLSFAGLVVGTELEALCEASTFAYQNKYLVNTFSRITLNRTLENIEFYTIDNTTDFSTYLEAKSDADQLGNLVDKYNQLIANVYSEECLNGDCLTGIEKNLEEIETTKSETLALKDLSNAFYRTEFDEFQVVYDRGVALINLLVAYRDNVLRPELLSLENFRALIESMQIEKNETFAFQDDPVPKIYRREIELFERFYRNGRRGTVEYSILLPFNSLEWNSTMNCWNGSDLTPFYAQKVSN